MTEKEQWMLFHNFMHPDEPLGEEHANYKVDSLYFFDWETKLEVVEKITSLEDVHVHITWFMCQNKVLISWGWGKPILSGFEFEKRTLQEGEHCLYEACLEFLKWKNNE